MPDSPCRFYLTTPIYYVNARPHIGHAYTTIVADVLARRHRLLGDDTYFLTGTDEHGQKIERSAAAAGIPPQQFADGVSASFESLWKRMGITNDRFIRTTDPRHKHGAQKLFRTLYDRGQIYLSSYTGQYCVSEEMFVEGPPGTIGPDGRPTETVTEENFFFRLSDFQLPLLNLIESGQLAITPEARRNEVLSFLGGNVRQAILDSGDHAWNIEHADFNLLGLKDVEHFEDRGAIKTTASGRPYAPGALKDLSISRSSFTWGIPVPDLGPDAPKPDGNHVIYVWLDALANYMTALGYGSDTPDDLARFEKFWPADLHLVGKEIIRFHCVYWPAFLLAADLPLPKAVTAHGWLLFEESKMSKSRGNIVRTETILDGFGKEVYAKQFPDSTRQEQDLFATDVLRYFLLREIPFGQDGSFSFDAMITRYNADLANGYGNLVSRTLNLIDQNISAACADQESVDIDRTTTRSNDAVEAAALDTLRSTSKSLESFDFSRYLEAVFNLVAATDSYITSEAPWKIAKARLPNWQMDLMYVLYTAAESIRIITALLYPFVPDAAARVWSQLGLSSIEEAARRGDLRDLQWGSLADLEPGTLGPLSPIFPRADKGLAQIMADTEANPTPKDLTGVTADNDAATSERTEFAQAPLNVTFEPVPLDPSAPDADLPAPSRFTGETNATAAPHQASSTAPDAGPRSLAEPNPIAQVAGAAAPHPDLPRTPGHAEAPASGPFASQASAQPITATPADASPQITIDDFAKVELRVARILVAERIPKADKLLRLEVDLGPQHGHRQILSGIAEFYTPEDLIGRRIVVITNLAPRKMRGLESHGMLLAASAGDNGKPILATMAEDIALGSRLK